MNVSETAMYDPARFDAVRANIFATGDDAPKMGAMQRDLDGNPVNFDDILRGAGLSRAGLEAAVGGEASAGVRAMLSKDNNIFDHAVDSAAGVIEQGVDKLNGFGQMAEEVADATIYGATAVAAATSAAMTNTMDAFAAWRNPSQPENDTAKAEVAMQSLADHNLYMFKEALQAAGVKFADVDMNDISLRGNDPAQVVASAREFMQQNQEAGRELA